MYEGSIVQLLELNSQTTPDYNNEGLCRIIHTFWKKWMQKTGAHSESLKKPSSDSEFRFVCFTVHLSIITRELSLPHSLTPSSRGKTWSSTCPNSICTKVNLTNLNGIQINFFLTFCGRFVGHLPVCVWFLVATNVIKWRANTVISLGQSNEWCPT